MKREIRKKLKTFLNLELPLIQSSRVFSDDLTVFGKDLPIFSMVKGPILPSNIENCAEIMVGLKGFLFFTL